MEISRQDYWSGLPRPSPGDLPNPGIELTTPEWAGGFFTAEPPGKPLQEAGNYKSPLLSISGSLLSLGPP